MSELVRPEARVNSSASHGPSASATSRACPATESGGLCSFRRSKPSSARTSSAARRRCRSLAQELVRPAREPRRDLPGNGEDLAAQLEREVRRDQRSGSLPRLDHDGGKRESGDDPVARGETPWRRLDSGLVLRHDLATLADPARELRVRPRVVAVDTAAEDRDGLPARLERAAMGLAVDPAGKAADHDEPGAGKRARQAPCHLRPVGGAGARADDRDGRARRGSPAGRRGDAGVRAGRGARPEAADTPARRAGARGRSCRDRRARWERGTRAPRPRAPAAPARRLRAPRRSPPPARPALDRAPRAAGASTARARSSSAARADARGRRPQALDRAARTRVAHGLRRPRPEPRARSRGRAACGRPDRSGRAARARAVAVGGEARRQSRSTRPRIAARAARAQVHRPDEQEARRKDVPVRTRARSRSMPSSSGWRSASSAGRWNSASSSRSRTPRWARLASPGRGPGPAADDRRRRRRVVRRPERRPVDQRAVGRQQARDGVDPRHLERLLARERRQDPRKPPREHRLARSGRPARAGGCDGRPPRSRAPAGRAPGRGRRRGRAAAASVPVAPAPTGSGLEPPRR